MPSDELKDEFRYFITRFKDEFGEEFLGLLAERAIEEIYGSVKISNVEKLHHISLIQQECLKWTRPLLAQLKSIEERKPKPNG